MYEDAVIVVKAIMSFAVIDETFYCKGTPLTFHTNLSTTGQNRSYKMHHGAE